MDIQKIRTLITLVIITTSVVSCGLLKPRVITPESKLAANKDVQAKAFADLAGGYLELGRLDLAKTEALKALELDPSSAAANSIYGLLNMKIGNSAEAEKYLNYATRLEPENPEFQNNLALYYCQNNRATEGMRLLSLVLQNRLYVNPQNSIMNAGICSETLGKYDEAEKYYRKAMTYSNFRLYGKEKLAGLYLKTNRAQEAWKEINELFTELSPPQPGQYELMINIANAVGQTAKAQQLQQKLQGDYPEYLKSKQTQTSNLGGGQNKNYGNYQPQAYAPAGQHPYPTQPQAIYPTQPQAVYQVQPQIVYPTQPQAIYPTQPQAVYQTQPQVVYPAQQQPMQAYQPNINYQQLPQNVYGQQYQQQYQQVPQYQPQNYPQAGAALPTGGAYQQLGNYQYFDNSNSFNQFDSIFPR